MTDNELLKYAIENGIINTALLQEKVDMQKKKAILAKHTYKIYQGNDGKWYTYLPDDNGRKKIKAITEEKLLDKVVSFYEERAEKEEKVTVEEIFQRWSSWKLTNKDVSKQTIDRYTIDFDKYFADIFTINRPSMVPAIREANPSQMVPPRRMAKQPAPKDVANTCNALDFFLPSLIVLILSIVSSNVY